MPESRVAYIPDHMVGDTVVDGVHHPLEHRSDSDDDSRFHEYLRHIGEVNIVLACDLVDGVSNEDRRVERQSHDDHCKYHRNGDEKSVPSDVVEHLFHSALRGGLPCPFCVRHLYRLLLELGIVDLAVYRAVFEKLVMPANSDYLSVVEHDYLVSVLYRGGALGYDEHCGIAVHLADRLTERGVGREIQRGGAVVKYQYFGLPYPAPLRW